MKRILMLLLAIAVSTFAKDVWRVTTDKYFFEWGKEDLAKHAKIDHGTFAENRVTVKWNVRKGRINIVCKYCDDDDQFAVRYMDKDSLRIGYIDEVLYPNKTLAGDTYKVHVNVIEDIHHIEIIPLRNWRATAKLICKDGYVSKFEPDIDITISDIKDVCNSGEHTDKAIQYCVEALIADNSKCVERGEMFPSPHKRWCGQKPCVQRSLTPSSGESSSSSETGESSSSSELVEYNTPTQNDWCGYQPCKPIYLQSIDATYEWDDDLQEWVWH